MLEFNQFTHYYHRNITWCPLTSGIAALSCPLRSNAEIMTRYTEWLICKCLNAVQWNNSTTIKRLCAETANNIEKGHIDLYINEPSNLIFKCTVTGRYLHTRLLYYGQFSLGKSMLFFLQKSCHNKRAKNISKNPPFFTRSLKIPINLLKSMWHIYPYRVSVYTSGDSVYVRYG